jgi:hypothetical protein
MGVEEAKLTRMIMREIGRHPLNISRLSVRASHGVVYLFGQVSKLRGHESMDLKEEMNTVYRCLRSKQEVKEVHMEELVLR